MTQLLEAYQNPIIRMCPFLWIKNYHGAFFYYGKKQIHRERTAFSSNGNVCWECFADGSSGQLSHLCKTLFILSPAP